VTPPLLGTVFDAIGMTVGIALTLMVFSYLLGNNAAFRSALHLFLGVTIGYAFGLVCWEVLILRVSVPLLLNRDYLVLAPVGLGLLLVFKLFRGQTAWGNPSIGFLLGTGAAVAVGGALLGTIVPLVGATAKAASPSSRALQPLGGLDAVLMVLGTASTLIAFRAIGRQDVATRGGCARPATIVSRVGRWFLVVAFGVLFGGALSTSLTIFIGRVEFIVGFVRGLF
jgi:hypothetical protein